MGRGGAGDTAVGSSYGTISAFVFVFNLVVGTGTLALPRAMADAGWLLSVVFLVVVGVFAFISATFVIEAQAAANALLKSRPRLPPPSLPLPLPLALFLALLQALTARAGC